MYTIGFKQFILPFCGLIENYDIFFIKNKFNTRHLPETLSIRRLLVSLKSSPYGTVCHFE